MPIKDLFNDINRIGTTTTSSVPSHAKVQEEIESISYAYEVQRDKDRFIPHVDYSKPENFAKYGSAEEYYKVAIESIYNYYPYDGSLKEKEEWYNNATYFETFIFDKEYPRTNGYALLSADGWGTQASTNSGYGLPNDLEYISFKSGPNKKNIWDEGKKREENLKFALSGGVTIEFWLKKDAYATALTNREVIFDLWNSKHSNEHDYGRLRIELSGTSPGPVFRLTALSGATGFHNAPIGTTVTPSTVASSEWSHYAFTIQNTGSTIAVEMYRNGAYVETVLTGSGIDHVTGSIYAYIGANTTPPKYTLAATGSGKLSGSIDDFRYWKTKRSARDIGRYYISQVGGGTNTDDANVDLGLYFKFNEGISNIANIDSTVLDYSGRLSNGSWTGYDAHSRNTGSAMVSSGKADFEFKDPIIYSSHPDVVAFKELKTTLGERHDIQNFSSMYKSIPAWIVEDDEESGQELKKLTQIMSSYFDELHNQIENLPSLKNIQYPSGSVLTGSFKPYPFSKRLLTSHGLDVPELFVDTSIIENFLSRDEEKKFEDKIYNTKNLIYQNIYNNLLFILKSKGTEKSINNLIRAFGANEDIINVNVYGKETDYEFRKNVKYKSIRKKLIDFDKPDRNLATIYNYKSGSGTTSYISGSDPGGLYVANTVEAEIVFPRKVEEGIDGYYSFPNLTSSLFGQHTADTSLPENNLGWNVLDHAGFQVYAVRNKHNSKDAYFVLTGSLISPMVTNVYKDVYDEEKWNFAVRIRPSSSFGNLVSDGGSLGYRVEFYGVNQRLGNIENEFILSSSMSVDNGKSFLSSSKRVYAGAHRTNFSGSLLDLTDIKLSYLRFWMDDIKDHTIKDHAIGMYSYGPSNPYKNSAVTDTSLGQVEIPELETLALNWDFKNVSSSADSSGIIFVDDFSSGSSDLINRYGWIGNITKQLYTARVDKLNANENNVGITDFILTTQNRLPEEFISSDMISIGEDSDQIFTKDTRPVDYFFSIENSMYRVISEEIINIFSSIIDFNNLVGEPVNRYRKEYKDLGKLRQLFFERVENKPDIERYLDYFKHVDSFIQEMLEQLIPASSNVSDSVLNMVESHVLERNKYDHKFPTLESKQPDPITTIQGINELLYNWKFGHAPITNKQGDNCTYWHELAERAGSVITSGDATVDSQRETIKTVVNTEVSGSTYATRKLGKSYRFATKLSNDIEGGSNIKSNNLFNFHRQAIKFNSSQDFIKFPFSEIQSNKNCDEDRTPEELRKRNVILKATTTSKGEAIDANDYQDGKANLLLPFTIFSSSVNTGYLGYLQTGASASFENMHRDVVGRNNQRPLQGPFTEKYVGGLQYRHAPLNYSASAVTNPGSTARSLDTPSTRPEGWYLKIPITEGSSLSLLSESFSGTDPVGWTNVGSTATGPSGWILTHSGPTPSAGTGPNSAFDGTHYAYAETSTPNHPGALFGLVTPKLDADDVAVTDFSASFYYHMHGVNVGNLKVQHSQDPTFGGGITDLSVVWDFVGDPTTANTFIAGQQQANASDAYIKAQIDLSSYAGTEFYLRFLYQGGITYLSDVAIDAIEVSGTAAGSMFKLLDPAYDSFTAMRAVYYRDEVAKRPLNIRNIKMTSSSPTIIGNYSNNYEVVNTSGRNINNIWFVQNSGNVASITAESVFISSSFDYALANRDTLQDGSRNKTVIVERFSAPGGAEVMSRGFLDVASETYSVYNCLNYRNSTVRNNLNLWNKHHSIFGGTSSFGTPQTTGSYHKVQRNTGKRIEWEGGVALTGSESIMNVITASYYDNGFITHQIPQTDSAYSWITGSIIQSVI